MIPKIELIPNRRGHYYNVEGYPHEFPSVTTILSATLPKPALAQWGIRVAIDYIRNRLLANPFDLENWPSWDEFVEWVCDKAALRPQEIATEAAGFGTRVHAACEAYAKGQEWDGVLAAFGADVEPSLQGFRQWIQDNDIRIDRSEQKLYSPTLIVAGSADIIGRRGTRRIVADIKTSKGIWPEFAYQVGGGYALMWDEVLGDEFGCIEEAWIIRLPKTAGEKLPFEAKRVKSLIRAKEGFKLLRRLFDIQKEKHFV